MSGWTVAAYVGTAFAVGTTAVQYDQGNNAKHQAKKAQEANEKLANAQLLQQEKDTEMRRGIANTQAAAAAAQAAEITKRADEAKATAQESARQGSQQQVAQANATLARNRAEELARLSQEDQTTQAPDVGLATDTEEPASRRRKQFSTPSASAVRV